MHCTPSWWMFCFQLGIGHPRLPQFLLLSNAKIILCRVLCIILTNNSLLIPRRLYNYHYLLCTLRVYPFSSIFASIVLFHKGKELCLMHPLNSTTASLKTKISQTKFNFLIINLSTHQILSPISHLLSHVRITSDR